MHTNELRLNSVSERIIGCALKVQNALGSGFLEKVYQNALAYELHKAGMQAVQQHGIAVRYADVVVGEYIVDLLVDDTVIVELKAVRALDDIHYAQCLNYLKATRRKLCLLLNFGTPRLQIKRIIL
jgi:GxxExxY protein